MSWTSEQFISRGGCDRFPGPDEQPASPPEPDYEKADAEEDECDMFVIEEKENR